LISTRKYVTLSGTLEKYSFAGFRGRCPRLSYRPSSGILTPTHNY
jgi:hypothetical protein